MSQQLPDKYHIESGTLQDGIISIESWFNGRRYLVIKNGVYLQWYETFDDAIGYQPNDRYLASAFKMRLNEVQNILSLGLMPEEWRQLLIRQKIIEESN